MIVATLEGRVGCFEDTVERRSTSCIGAAHFTFAVGAREAVEGVGGALDRCHLEPDEMRSFTGVHAC